MSDRAKPRTSSARVDGDAVRVIARDGRSRRATVLYQALALLLIVCSAGYILIGRSTPMATTAQGQRDAKQRDDAAAQPTASKITSASTRLITSRRAQPTPAVPARAGGEELEGDGDTTPDLSDFIPPGQAPTVGEVIEQLHEAGIYSGIGAFPPPGTSPPLVGLAVPADFELPEGYVRHFQATDDGERLEPILMFSPDYEFFGEDGEPIAIPENRVVPPELAPPGLPPRYIEIPPDREPGDASR